MSKDLGQFVLEGEFSEHPQFIDIFQGNRVGDGHSLFRENAGVVCSVGHGVVVLESWCVSGGLPG